MNWSRVREIRDLLEISAPDDFAVFVTAGARMAVDVVAVSVLSKNGDFYHMDFADRSNSEIVIDFFGRCDDIRIGLVVPDDPADAPGLFSRRADG